MNILITGNYQSVSKKLFSDIGKEYKCIKFSGKDEELNRICKTYDFKSVIYVSKTINGETDIFDELRQLEMVSKVCMQHKVYNFIYIISNDQYKLEEDKELSSRGILLQACKKLVKAYAGEGKNRITVIQVPYLYSMDYEEQPLWQWITSALSAKELKLCGKPDTITDFLCDEDLKELLKRILDAPNEEAYLELVLGGENAMSMEKLASCIQKEIAAATITYDRKNGSIPRAVKEPLARIEYGWAAMHSLQEEIPALVQKARKKEAKKSTDRKKHRFERKWIKKASTVLELIAMFLGTILLQQWTSENVMVGFLDFKFIFVIMMGMVHGMGIGVSAAILASGAYMYETAGNTHWQVIFYNVQNWLPFACYILAGAISGYIKEKYQNEVRFCKEEQKILEEKYIFLNEQYVRLLQNKDSFNSQIIGYQNSFGKMHSVVKKLNATLISEVLFEAVNVIEDMLQTNSVAIYSISGENSYARLNVCSKSLYNKLGKSLKLLDYPEMMAKLRENKIYVNIDCTEHYPTYAAPIYKDNELLGMIHLMEVDEHNMNMEFSNKLLILSDLIKDSLIRAIQHDNSADSLVEGTQIIKLEKFSEIIKVMEQMREKKYLQYALLRVYKDDVSQKEVADQVLSLVRTSDMVGLGNDNHLYLLLSQTGKKDIGIITERMKKNEIGFDIIIA